MQVKKILIAEDHPLISKGLTQLILSISVNAEIIVVESCEKFISAVKNKPTKYCIIDLNLVDGNAFRSIENALLLIPDLCILVYSTLPDAMYAKKLFKLGVHGFLNKCAPIEEVSVALHKFLQDEFYVSASLLPIMFDHIKPYKSFKSNPFDFLSNKELITIEYYRSGLSIKDIAEKMGIMPNTVATYKKRAFLKLDVENIIQLHNLYSQHQQIDSKKHMPFSDVQNSEPPLECL